jgi:hypothetical protein
VKNEKMISVPICAVEDALMLLAKLCPPGSRLPDDVPINDWSFLYTLQRAVGVDPASTREGIPVSTRRVQSTLPDRDMVEHPPHYRSFGAVCASCGHDIECIDVVQHLNFNRGNAVKYIWRAGAKGDEIEDLRKARQYLEFEIKRLSP